MDADLRRHSADEERRDCAVAQHQIEIRLVERTLARLVDDRFARQRREIVDDVMSRLAADEDASHRPGLADARLRFAAVEFGKTVHRTDPDGVPPAYG